MILHSNAERREVTEESVETYTYVCWQEHADRLSYNREGWWWGGVIDRRLFIH